MNIADILDQPIQQEDQDKLALSQNFLKAAAKINILPATKEYFHYSILPEMSLATHLNVDERLESCLKRYLLIQQGFALSGNSLSPNELKVLNHVAQTFSEKIAIDGPECNSAKTEY